MNGFDVKFSHIKHVCSKAAFNGLKDINKSVDFINMWHVIKMSRGEMMPSQHHLQ